MTQLVDWLGGGDLRSDGMAGEVARWVLERPPLLEELLVGLSVPDDVIRGRTADALEKISRERPELLVDSLRSLERAARRDPVPMVRWHLAMVLTNMVGFREQVGSITNTLAGLLKDESVFVKSWTLTGLCIVGRIYPRKRPAILRRLGPLQSDGSRAVRVRATKAVRLLLDDRLPLPTGWIKSQRLRSEVEGNLARGDG